ncbi:MAG: hypothetical protein N4A49_06225 [Marinifilaceae bacterium]|jgi:DNA repair exonuclease SbcCD ATPase subunit|nr:hypothetical protein [Marinifilaceae bacterium]
MNKIKRINISDFRIYEGTQEFNFEKDGSPANLVVLYAPNGYGKTSFYDAIEWSYSDKISRIGEPKKGEEIQQLDFNENIKDKIILTNRKSYQNKKIGKISILTSDGEIIKTVKPYTRRIQGKGKGTKNDYCEGNYKGIFNRDKLKELSSSNILSQDLIDSFLRHTTPEKKFEQLEKFTTQVEADLIKFKQVDDVYTSVLKRIDELKKEVIDKEKAIGKIKVDKSALDSINELIVVVTKIEEVDLQLLPLSEKISAEELEVQKENLLSGTNIVKSQIEQLDNLIQTAEELHKSFQEFEDAKKNEQECKKEISSLNEIKKLYTDKKTLSVVLEKNNKSFKDLNELLINYNRLFDSSKVADKIHKSIRNEREFLNGSQKKQLKAKTLIAKLNQRILELAQEKNRRSKTIDKYQTYLKEREQQILEEHEYDKYISVNEKKIIELDGIISPLTEELQKHREQKDLLYDILENKKWKEFKIFANEEYIHMLELYTQHLTEIKDVIEQQTSIEKKLKASGSLQENLERIKNWGAEFVSQTNTSTSKIHACPLCNTSFDTFELLLEAIEKDRIGVLDLEKNRANQKDLEKKKESLQNELLKFESFFKSIVEKQRQEVDKSIANKNKELESQKKFRSDYALEIQTAKRKKEILKEKISKAISQLNIPIDIKEEKYSQYIQDQIENFENRKSKLTSNKESYISFIDSINGVVASREVANNEKLAEIDKLEKDVAYVGFVALLKECNLRHEDVVSEGFKSGYIDVKEKQSQEIAKLISENKDKVLELTENIEKHACKVSEELLPGKLIEEESRCKTLSDTVESFTKKFKSINLSEVKSIEQIKEQINTNEKRIDILNNVQKYILSIQSKSEILSKQIDKKALEKELQDLKEEEEKYSIAHGKLRETRKNCVKHIQKGIETTFNKKVINEIYQRIEPHPSLDEIYFRAEIGENGKPRLVITTKGGGDELNPNIFLSAGQVNVLSLSIFLAKAYEYGSEVISTIFMDDPIQNLSDINILSFIDVLRTLTQDHDKQIVISTHDEKFFHLLKNKMPEEHCNSKFIEFEAPGLLKS